MKFSCEKTPLERAVGIAERFTGKNVALPVLANILLSAEGNHLVITATNLEHAVQFRMPARVGLEGKTSVSAKILSSLLQSLGDEKIDAEAERGNLRIRTAAREGRINGTNPDEFPLVPKIKRDEEFRVEALALARGLSRVLPATSVSEFKPELGGVFFRAGKDNLTLCATDTFRLAECSTPLAKERSGEGVVSFILPHRLAGELARILDGEDGVVTIALGENQVVAETASGKVISRVVEGNFPEYKAIIPTRFTTSVHMAKNDLIHAIRAASIFASKLQETTLRLGLKQFEVAAANPDVGEYRTSHPAALNGREISMSFNWRYLLDGVQALDEEEIFFGCNEESSPALLRDKSHTTFNYVVMPIRLT